MAKKKVATKASKRTTGTKAAAPVLHQGAPCIGAGCVYCLQQRDAQRIVAGDTVTESKAQVGDVRRVGTVSKVVPVRGSKTGEVTVTVEFADNAQRTGKASDFVRTGAVKVLDPKLKVPRDLSVYQVFRDIHGIAYLRVELGKTGNAKFIVNKGFEVELVEMDGGSARALYLQPVVGSSIYECGKRLLHPLNDQVTISMRAKTHLEQILSNEELRSLATMKTQATKTAKFAAVTAPAAKGSKKAAKAAPAKKAAAKKDANGGGKNLDNKVIKVKIKENPLREGTFCFAQVKALMASDGKTVAAAQSKLDASGLNPNERRIEIAWAVKKGYITVADAK